jgi:hypothetical protein
MGFAKNGQEWIRMINKDDFGLIILFWEEIIGSSARFVFGSHGRVIGTRL